MSATFIALLHRDLRVARRELPYFLLRTGLQPLLFTFIFGFVMPRLGIIQRGYTGMLLPGILGLSMTLSSMQAVALPLVIDFGWTKEIEDRLLAPISISGVAIEKILVGILQAMIAGLVVLPRISVASLIVPQCGQTGPFGQSSFSSHSRAFSAS